jgi:hypothetical protein
VGASAPCDWTKRFSMQIHMPMSSVLSSSNKTLRLRAEWQLKRRPSAATSGRDGLTTAVPSIRSAWWLTGGSMCRKTPCSVAVTGSGPREVEGGLTTSGIV